jgi:hypothetical protein
MKRACLTFALVNFLAAPLRVFGITGTATPLPSVETVLQRVAEKSAEEDENNRVFEQRYFYTRTKVTEYRNSKGEVKKREEKRGDNDPYRKSRETHRKSSNAKSSSAGGTEPNEAVSETHSNVRGKAFEKKDFLMDEELLKRFDFTVAGREILNGRPALIVDFQPAKKQSPARNLKERFINKAAGRVWVDEADYALVKADLHLTEHVNVLGGLVGAVWNFTYGFLRERTPDGLWFTRNTDWHLEGRELFVRRTVDYHEERDDVRKVF